MFSFPVTIPIRTDESIFPMDVHVQIDDIAVVKPLLDNSTPFGVGYAFNDPLLPNSEIIFIDGRRLLVLETPATLIAYLDAYRSLDSFFTTGRAAAVEEAREGVVVPLFKGGQCDTSEESTPA